MPDLNFNCSVYQGFNFKKDIQDHVGHVTELKIGDAEALKADLNVTDPVNITKDPIPVVGVMSGIHWSTGYAEPVFMGFQVSLANKTAVATMLHKTLSNTEVKFKFNVYEYDPKEKTYFLCFHSKDTLMKGLVLKSGGDLDLDISTTQSGEVESPKNFSMSIGIMPQDEQQELHLAVDNSAKFVKQWGIDVK